MPNEANLHASKTVFVFPSFLITLIVSTSLSSITLKTHYTNRWYGHWALEIPCNITFYIVWFHVSGVIRCMSNPSCKHIPKSNAQLLWFIIVVERWIHTIATNMIRMSEPIYHKFLNILIQIHCIHVTLVANEFQIKMHGS